MSTGTTTDFPPPVVLTITATATLGCAVDIVSVAKYQPLTGPVTGTKMTYADGNRIIVRGDCKMPQSKGAFNNQTSLVVALAGEKRHVHVKVFNNGSLQIAGPKSVDETMQAWEAAYRALDSLRGCRSVDLQSGGAEDPLIGMDDLLYNINGDVIGWSLPGGRFLCCGDTVVIEKVEGVWCFVSESYKKKTKGIYSLDGERIGERKLIFSERNSRCKYAIENGRIFSGADIVGAENTLVDPYGWLAATEDRSLRARAARRGRLLCCFSALAGVPLAPDPTNLLVHMVNTQFVSPFNISRDRLHKCFLKDDLVSRWDPCANPGVSLRYYDNVLNTENPGKCPCKNRLLSCSCKKINIRCFDKGTIIVTGLKEVGQVDEIYAFMVQYYLSRRSLIQEGFDDRIVRIRTRVADR